MRIALILAVVLAIVMGSIAIVNQSRPSYGTVVGYEDFKGHEVPIKADGKGGTFRWIGDVPWEVFTLEEKFMMAFQGGAWLTKAEIDEAWEKYGEWRK